MPKAKTEKAKDPNLYVSIPREAFRGALYEILEQLRECANLRQSISTQMDVLEDVEHSIRETVEKLNNTLYGAKWWECSKHIKEAEEEFLDEYIPPPLEPAPEGVLEAQPAPLAPGPQQLAGALATAAPQNIPLQAGGNAAVANVGNIWGQIFHGINQEYNP